MVTQIADGDFRTWFAAHPPDAVLYHFGTNDVWNGVATATILEAHSRVLGFLREVNPRVIVLAAQIIPISANPGGNPCPACPDRVEDLNAALVTWAENTSTTASPVFVVDQWTGFDAEIDTTDGVHPYPESGTQSWPSDGSTR